MQFIRTRKKSVTPFIFLWSGMEIGYRQEKKTTNKWRCLVDYQFMKSQNVGQVIIRINFKKVNGSQI